MGSTNPLYYDEIRFFWKSRWIHLLSPPKIKIRIRKTRPDWSEPPPRGPIILTFRSTLLEDILLVSFVPLCHIPQTSWFPNSILKDNLVNLPVGLWVGFIHVLDLLDFGMDCLFVLSWLVLWLDCNGTPQLPFPFYVPCYFCESILTFVSRLIYDSFKLYCGLPTTGAAKK